MGENGGQVFQPEGGFRSMRVPFDDVNATRLVTDGLESVLQLAGDKPVVIVCVGTDRSTGDAFGPIIGSKLQNIQGVTVYGSLDEPVHAVNLAATLEQIQSSYTEAPFVLAIDACLGKFDHVGHIIIDDGPLRPGAGVNKTLPEFGNATITGVVNVCGFMEYFVLQNTRLGVVMRMTDIVAEAVRRSVLRWQLGRSLLSRA